jgi:hypothetical protein
MVSGTAAAPKVCGPGVNEYRPVPLRVSVVVTGTPAAVAVALALITYTPAPPGVPLV